MDLKPKWKAESKLVTIYVYYSIQHSIQIAHLCDFKYWEIFQGLTVEQIREREQSFEYPPRLQIKCEQIDYSKSLYSSFEISKRSEDMEKPIDIVTFPLIKKAAGNHLHNYIASYVHMHRRYLAIRTYISMYVGIFYRYMWLLYFSLQLNLFYSLTCCRHACSVSSSRTRCSYR